MRPGDPNLDMLELMAAKLGQLTEQLVFVGGSTTGLFITDPLLPPVRVTRDVDVTLYADPMFAEAVSGFLPGDAISQTRAPRILRRIAALAGKKT